MNNYKKIRCYDLEGNKLQDFNSLKEACSLLSLSSENISQCINGKQNSVSSFQFREFKGKNLPNNIGSISFIHGLSKIPVAKYWGDNLISVYNSISEAAEKNKIEFSIVQKGIKRKQKLGMFTFKMIGDD